MPFEIVRNDIVNMQVDAVVNTANPMPVIGAGVDSAIHKAAGPMLLQARQKIGMLDAGKAAITKGYDLNAGYVIHTVGPVWKDGSHGEEKILASCYRSSLKLALEYGCESIAFPLISAGSYGYPKALALQTAVSEISSFLMENEMQIYLVVFGSEAFALSEKLFKSVSSYIDEHYISDKMLDEYGSIYEQSSITRQNNGDFLPGRCLGNLYTGNKRGAVPRPVDDLDSADSGPELLGDSVTGDIEGKLTESESIAEYQSEAELNDDYNADYEDWQINAASDTGGRTGYALGSAAASSQPADLSELLNDLDMGFSETLLKLIDRTGKKDSDIYKKANVDRKLFSKIRNNTHYQPSKPTALAFAFALELDIDETRDFIARAGFALSHSSKFDIIVEYFLVNHNYNVFELNEVLFAFDQPLIGAKL